MSLYRLYGLHLRSEWPLPYRAADECGPTDLELVDGRPSNFARAREEAGADGNPTWFQWSQLADGTTYLRWAEMFEFLVSADGSRIAGHSLAVSSQESFSTYLLGQVISFALLRRGVEPLHATVIDIHGEGAAFLGDSGYGKSSLGGAFLQGGHRLLTDDLLVLKRDGGSFRAYPGPPRIKLLPEMAGALLREMTAATPMNPLTTKLIIPLAQGEHSEHPIPLRAMYVLSSPAGGRKPKTISIRRLSQRQSFLAVLRNTFNTRVTEPERLKRQFTLAVQLAQCIPIKRLSYPRDLSVLPGVRAAVLADLARCKESKGITAAA